MRSIGRAVLFACRVGLVSVAAFAIYLHYLAHAFDVTRESFEARARSVEVSMVPKLIAGPDGRPYDSALELPLSLPQERIPDFVKNAFITQEDQQFRSFWHFGVNPVRLAEAVMAEFRRTNGRFGASTITMQLVKNVLLSQDRTYDRKYYQIVLAVLVELLFTKDEILAMYVNTAYFGDGAYGIEAAARRFFGRSVGYSPAVNLIEAAMLAASVKSPSRLNPSKDRATLERKARALVGEMAEQGYEVAAGQDVRDRGPRDWNMSPYLFRDMALRFMMPPELRDIEDPLTVSVTVDTEAQLYADLAAVDLLREAKDAGYDSSVIIVMEPTGALVAVAAGHDYDGKDLVRNGRVSPGSTLKPFMYLCALENGAHPDDVVDDVKREWPRNFTGVNYGDVTLEFAFIRSLNTIAVQLFENYGADCFADVLKRFGIRLYDARQRTAVLGSQYVSLLSLASAYAALANGGHRIEPYAVRFARNRAGRTVYRHVSPLFRERVVEERPYCDLIRMMRNVTSSKGTGKAAAVDRPVWGKTGTSQGHRDALFAGFTGRYVAVVWLGRQAAGNPRRPISGGELPAETFGWLISTLEAGKPPATVECRPRIEVAGRAGGIR